MTSMPKAPPVPGRLEQLSTRIAFLLPGSASLPGHRWCPTPKSAGRADDATLGLLLLSLGRRVDSGHADCRGWPHALVGCRRVLTAGTLLICLSLPLLATVSSIPLLIATLFVFGAGLGTIDSTVNLQAVIVERASGRNMMSGFHGLFSVGGIVGAAGVSGLLAIGLTPLGQWPWSSC
jgi:MFS family permease